ncbi:MAG: GNAT family N-acetyltransferase [Sarcina sp.]
MEIRLEPISEINFNDCLALEVNDNQKEYIVSNEFSLTEALEHPYIARPFLIYNDSTAIGFTMLAFDDSLKLNDRFWIWRFMIDKKFQSKGLGKIALKKIIAYFIKNQATVITLSTKENNIQALKLYESLGFFKTGELNDEEIILRLFLPSN